MSDDDDLPIFRPKFGKRQDGSQRANPPRFRNAVLALMLGKGARGSKQGSRGRSRIAVRTPTPLSRRVAVKVHVAPNRASSKAAALHLAYIQRDGVAKDRGPGDLYGADGLLSSETFGSPRANEKHQFRLIVSPEDADELDLTIYVRRFMSQVEQDLGRRLEWAAVNHYDTDNPHAHVVIRGVDRDGQEVRMPRDYVSHGLRHQAQHLATEELGPRAELDLVRQRRREVTLDRFTDLDRSIEKRAMGDRIEFARALKTDWARQVEGFLHARLEHLETLQLAEKEARRSWRLVPGWKEHLRALSIRNDIIKQMHLAIGGNASTYRILERDAAPGENLAHPPESVQGRVIKKGLRDELRGSYFAVVESPSGEALYVPLGPRAAEALRQGDSVRVERRPEKWRRPVDEEIQRIAEGNEPVTPSKTTELHEKRLAQLAKLGLATRQPDGQWQIAEGLLEKLDAKEKTDPRGRWVVDRQRLRLQQQVEHPGPVWLDGVGVEPLATFGFGGELRDAIAARREVLRQHGIDPEDPRRHMILRSLERDGVARHISEETGARFVSKALTFRGTVRIHEAPGGDAPYAEIRDGSKFAVVRAYRQLRAAAASKQTVVITRNKKGRYDVQLADRDRDRGGS